MAKKAGMTGFVPSEWFPSERPGEDISRVKKRQEWRQIAYLYS